MSGTLKDEQDALTMARAISIIRDVIGKPLKQADRGWSKKAPGMGCRRYTKPPFNHEKAKTRRKMAQASRKINRRK